MYSLAICLHELLGANQLSLVVQLFGTDISEIALERARQGIYPGLIAQDVSPERLKRFFNKMDGGYQVDHDLRVRRFNPAAEKLVELSAIDIGRPVAHIRSRIDTSRLEQQIQTVLESLHVSNEEVQDAEGHWYSIAVRPYRTVDDHIAGAVVTFQDIDLLKRGLGSAEEARDYAEATIETVREPLVVLDGDLRVQHATSSFYENFMVTREETEGRVRAIARIHERLYASEDLTMVEFAGYLTGLARELVALHATVPNGVNLNIDVQDMALHIEQAIPLGLIANELILNSLKHGLTQGVGDLRVSLSYVPDHSGSGRGETLDEGWAQFRIADNGPGLPAGLDLSRTLSLGFRLVHLLVRQLGARLEIGPGPGASFTVMFPLQYR